MGKDKTAQRTKGNKKPSSSGRTAELLGGVSGFVGFSALQDLGYVPAATQADDSTISAEFRVTLRKMTKKDSTTKIKALQEFEVLCQNEDQESILSALPFWPRLYTKLSIDVERRVREATQVAHGALVTQVGKQLAPHLKSIMPSWMLAMADPYPPAATAATKAFQTAFSEEKRAEVMIFCCKEIMDFITDNLFKQTPQTLSDPKVTDPEDMKNKFIRVLACSLNAVSLLLTSTAGNSEKQDQIMTMVMPLVQNPSFWKIPKTKHPLVRSAWFSTIKDMFEYDPQLLGNSAEDLNATILPALDDQDGSVLSHIWIAFLHLCVAHPGFWGDKNNKSVLKRMYSVMREGARGSAGELYPQLLKEKILSSSRDVSSIIKSLYECLCYVSKKVNDTQLWDTLMKYQVVELLRSSFTDTPQLSTSNLYREVAGLLRFFSGKSQTGEKLKFLNELFTLFWKKIIPECENLIQQGSESVHSKMITFFYVLKNPQSTFSHRREGIKFSDEVDIKVLSADEKSTEQYEKEIIFLETTGVTITPLIFFCYSKYLQEKSLAIYNIFSALLSSFPSPSTYTALVHGLGEEKPVDARELLEQVILPKMEEENSFISQPTVNIFMSLYVLLDQAEQKLVLMNFKPCLSVCALRLLVEKMTDRRESDEVAAEWLLSPQLGGRLVQLVDGLCGPAKVLPSTQHLKQQEELISLFNFVLRNGNKKEPVIAMEYISQILTKLSINLKVSGPGESEPEDPMVQLVANLAGQLFSSYVCWQTRGIHEFMNSLFLLLCQSSKSLSVVTVDLLKTTFLKAFKGLIASVATDNPDKLLEEGSCLSSTLKDIKQTVIAATSTFHLTMAMAELTHHLLMMVFKQVPKEDCSIMLDHSQIQAMLNLLLPTEGEWAELEAKLSPMYVVSDILLDIISCSEFPFPKSMHENLKWEHTHTQMSMFICDLLLFLSGSGDEDVSSMKEEQVSLGQYTHLVGSALHSACHATAVQELNEHLQNKTVSEDIKTGTEKLNEDMRCLLKLLNQGNKRLVTKQIRDRCSDGSSFWCVTFINVLNNWMYDEDINGPRLMDGLEENSLGYTATKQCLLPLLPQETKVDLLAEEMGKLSSYSEDPFSATPSVAIITTALSYVPSSVTNDVVCSIFSVLTQWRENADNIFLFATDVTNMGWEDIVLTCSLVRLVSALVKSHAVHFDPSHWDFILCSLSSWVQSLEESKKSIANETVAGTFACAVCKCVFCVGELMEVLKCNPKEREKYPPKLLEDWMEFFSPSMYNSLIPLFVEVAASYRRNPSVILYGVCRAVCFGVCYASSDDLANHSLPPIYNATLAEEEMKLPDSEQILLNHLTPLLMSSHAAPQCTAYMLLSAALPKVMAQWEMNQIAINEEEDTPQRPLPYSMINIIKDCSKIVEQTLADTEMGDGFVVQPDTKSSTYIAGYLLAWKLTVTAITYASDANQHQYSAYLQQTNLLQSLLQNLFKLMPPHPVIDHEDDIMNLELPPDFTCKTPLTKFNSRLYITPFANVTSRMVAHLACKVYYDCVSRIPAAVRQWFISLDRQRQPIVDAFTTTYVSPILINQEMSAINKSSVKFDNMTMNTMLSYRNTPLLQSLVFWKENVDQKFEGIEECYICYYVLHGTNHQLPKLLCRTCKKKFHSACLQQQLNLSSLQKSLLKQPSMEVFTNVQDSSTL
ncbi:E3 ubiquitin-protein ligase listerin-like, partial [Homarus americanus]